MDADATGKLVFSAVVGIGIEVFAEGVMMPMVAVGIVVVVLPCTMMVFTLPIEDTSTFGVGARLGLLVAFADDGGIRPDAPVENVVAVEPPVEIISNPEEMVTFGTGDTMPDTIDEGKMALGLAVEEMSSPDETVKFGNGVKSELGTPTFVEVDGGMMPDSPIENVIAVDPPVEETSMPEDTMLLMLGLGVEDESNRLVMLIMGDLATEGVTGGRISVVMLGIVLAGGMIPVALVEFKVYVLLPIVTLALPTIDNETAIEALGTGLGGTIPDKPGLNIVAVAPDTVNSADPTETVSMGCREFAGTLELVTTWML